MAREDESWNLAYLQNINSNDGQSVGIYTKAHANEHNWRKRH